MEENQRMEGKPHMWTTEETEILLMEFNSDSKEKQFKRNKMDFCRDVAATMNSRFIGRDNFGYVPLTAEKIKSKLTVIRQQLEQLPNATDSSSASQGTSLKKKHPRELQTSVSFKSIL